MSSSHNNELYTAITKNRMKVLDRYWRVYDTKQNTDDKLDVAMKDIFSDDAIWESERLPEAIVGREAITHHIKTIRTGIVSGTKSRSEVQWSSSSPEVASWDWKVTNDDGSTVSGKDIVEFSASPPFLVKRIKIQRSGPSDPS